MIIGNVENRIVKGKRVNSFPKFTSYSKNIELKNIFSNIDYRGGYILQGKDFVADGGINAEARIVFKRDGEDIFIANATRFNIGDEKIVAKQAGVKIFLKMIQFIMEVFSLNISTIKDNYNYIKIKRVFQELLC